MSHKLPMPNCGSHERTRLAGVPGKPYRFFQVHSCYPRGSGVRQWFRRQAQRWLLHAA